MAKHTYMALLGILIILIGFVIGFVIVFGKYKFTSSKPISKSEQVATTSDDVKGITFTDKDMIFYRGFADLNLPWPPIEEDFSDELKRNPMCALRASYCQRVGYQYADFGCDCFVYQYYDSFETFMDTKERLSLYYPRLWHKSTRAKLEFMDEQKLSLERDGAVCNLVYGKINEQKLAAQGTVSTTSTIIDEQELTQTSIAFNRPITDEEHASGYTNDKILAIPHFPYANSEFGLAVTSFEDQPLVEACQKEFESIAKSRLIEFPVGKLTQTSKGNIVIHDQSIWYTTGDEPSNKLTLLFNNDATKRQEALGNAMFEGTNQILHPFVLGNTFYYLEGNKVKMFDLFGSTASVVPLPYDEKYPVHSFFVEGNWIYFMYGKFCNEYMAQCNLNLDRYNFETKEREYLANGLSSREVLGFNAAKNTLYMAYTWGDAGCMARSYEAYSFTTKKASKLGDYSYCVGDAPKENKFEKLIADVEVVDQLLVGNGKISLPAEKIAQRGNAITVNLSKDAGNAGWVKFAFPYPTSFDVWYPEQGWKFECCGDRDDGSMHWLMQTNGSKARVVLFNYVLMLCKDRNSLCGLDEVVEVTAQEFYNFQKKSIQGGTPMRLEHLNAHVVKYTDTNFSDELEEVYLIGTPEHVMAVTFILPDELGSNFITEFLNRLELSQI